MAISYENVPSPCYVLEVSRLRKNLALIRDVQESAGVSIILALKGFAMWRVFPLVREYLSGATASSLHEARLIFEEMGCLAHTYAPAYRPEDLSEILRYSSHVSFNSLSEFMRHRPLLGEAPHPVSPGLRVNPGYSDVSTELYNPASPVSRLGLGPEHLQNGLPEGVEGLHFHTLCESSAEATDKAIGAFTSKFGEHFAKLKWVNFGGGHLMTRKGYDLDRLIHALKAFREKYGLQVILEPGSAIAWDTGELVSTVLDIVENQGVRTAILDVSFTAHMPDTLEMPYRPGVIGASADPSKGGHLYRLGGSSCLAGDYHSEYSFDKPLRAGDKVIFKDMIHYTMVKTTTFNGVQHPAIALWHENDKLEITRQFGYADYKNRLA